MIAEVVMPQLGTTMTEGLLERWLKHVGDPVRQGDELAEISTDKYTTEIVSEHDGYLRKILVDEGELVPVLSKVALISTLPDEALPGRSEPAQPAPGVASGDAPGDPFSGGAPAQRRTPASPLARKTALELGIAVEEVPTAHHRVKREDVLAYAASARDSAPAAPAADGGPDEVIPVTSMRRTIAARMSQSLAEAPQVTLTADAHATSLLELRSAYNATGRGHITVNDLMVKIAARALVKVPAMNASYTPEGIVRHRSVHIGIAVALEDGLVVPAVRNADRLSVAEISGEALRLTQRAREGRLQPGELQGGTFTVSNIGKYGVVYFTPILNGGEAGILGVGKIERRPEFDVNGAVIGADILHLSLTFDHRAVDGAVAARLLQEIVADVENPAVWLLEG